MNYIVHVCLYAFVFVCMLVCAREVAFVAHALVYFHVGLFVFFLFFFLFPPNALCVYAQVLVLIATVNLNVNLI